MPAVGFDIKVDVDDAEMRRAIDRLTDHGFDEAMQRAVLTTARLARAILMIATRAAMHNEPGGKNPYLASNFKQPRIKRQFGAPSAGAGYTAAGYFVRFRSTGTKPRYRGSGALHVSRRGGHLIRTRDQGGGYTGIEIGLGMTQQAKSVADPQFPRIANLELQAELDAEGLG